MKDTATVVAGCETVTLTHTKEHIDTENSSSRYRTCSERQTNKETCRAGKETAVALLIGKQMAMIGGRTRDSTGRRRCKSQTRNQSIRTHSHTHSHNAHNTAMAGRGVSNGTQSERRLCDSGRRPSAHAAARYGRGGGYVQGKQLQHTMAALSDGRGENAPKKRLLVHRFHRRLDRHRRRDFALL